MSGPSGLPALRSSQNGSATGPFLAGLATSEESSLAILPIERPLIRVRTLDMSWTGIQRACASRAKRLIPPFRSDGLLLSPQG